MRWLQDSEGPDSGGYRALSLQYDAKKRSDPDISAMKVRHWQASLCVDQRGNRLKGIERLYGPSVAVQLTLHCAAHCRHCLRAHYDAHVLKKEELGDIARYCGSAQAKTELREVLISGGDPLTDRKRLRYFIQQLSKHAPNIGILRIGTRLPLHDPRRFYASMQDIVDEFGDTFRFEVATQINHPVELFPEVIAHVDKVKALNVRVYAQNVLLKNVNDDPETLVALYRRMRELDIDAHYLFHCAPIRGTRHLRTSVLKGLRLVDQLANSGRISGRAKPLYTLITDVGKVTLFHGAILKRDRDNRVLVQSRYRLDERLAYNPGWKLPKTAAIDSSGFLRVWYLDGED